MKRRLHSGFRRWALLAVLSLAASCSVLWVLSPHLFLPDADVYFAPAMSQDVRAQLEHFYHVWDDPVRRESALDAMHQQNPEWELISSTFFGYSLANIALKHPSARDRALRCMDLIIDRTLKKPWQTFLLPYGHERPFVRKPAASLMVDGEVSLLIGLRRLVRDEPDDRHRDRHRSLVKRCVQAMEAGPVLWAESYPDECWLFCHGLALASVKVFDVLEGTDHSDLFRRWERTARKRLLDKNTGILFSAVTRSGEMVQPPEGSSIWIGIYGLKLVAPTFAREQYELAKRRMTGKLACFRYGREWATGVRGQWDIDSGCVPAGMGPASTGFALIASKEMNDRDLFNGLVGTVELAGVPKERDGRMWYCSSNLVGDATFLLGKTTGPAWAEVQRRSKTKAEPP